MPFHFATLTHDMTSNMAYIKKKKDPIVSIESHVDCSTWRSSISIDEWMLSTPRTIFITCTPRTFSINRTTCLILSFSCINADWITRPGTPGLHFLSRRSGPMTCDLSPSTIHHPLFGFFHSMTSMSTHFHALWYRALQLYFKIRPVN